MARYRCTIHGVFKEDGSTHVEPVRASTVPCCKEKPAVDAEVWGPPAWAELHGSTAIPTDFAERIPCDQCRAHFLAYVAAHPPPVGVFYQWSVDAHNECNARLGKKIWP